jgi:pimeloyl-ACP methyl ester carboxylesterase
MLSHKLIGSASPKRICYVLHGLLGSGRNWGGFSSALLRASAPDWGFVLLDLRGHAGSKGSASFPGPHSLAACARDVLAFSAASGLVPQACLGHSLGGKVLLELAAQLGQGAQQPQAWSAPAPAPPLQLFIVDSLPGPTLPEHETGPDSVSRVLQLIARMGLPLASRSAVKEAFLAEGFSATLATWMASNVQVEEGSSQLGWTFDPAAAQQLYADHMALDRWAVLQQPPARVQLELIMASRAGRWQDAAVQAQLGQLRGQAALAGSGSGSGSGSGRGGSGSGSGSGSCATRLHTVEGGHWLHIDNPAGLIGVMAPYFGAPLGAGLQ